MGRNKKLGAMFLLSALVTALLAMTALGASAQQYPPIPQDQIATQPAPPGGTLTVTACCFQPGSTVSLTINWNNVSADAHGNGFFIATIGPVFKLASNHLPTITYTATADADGAATFDIEVPEGAPEGEATGTVEGVDEDGNPVAYSVTLTVAEAAPGDGSTDGDEVAATGAGVTNLMLLAALVVVLGGGALAYAKARGAKDEEATTKV